MKLAEEKTTHPCGTLAQTETARLARSELEGLAIEREKVKVAAESMLGVAVS